MKVAAYRIGHGWAVVKDGKLIGKVEGRFSQSGKCQFFPDIHVPETGTLGWTCSYLPGLDHLDEAVAHVALWYGLRDRCGDLLPSGWHGDFEGAILLSIYEAVLDEMCDDGVLTLQRIGDGDTHVKVTVAHGDTAKVWHVAKNETTGRWEMCYTKDRLLARPL